MKKLAPEKKLTRWRVAEEAVAAKDYIHARTYLAMWEKEDFPNISRGFA